MTASTATKLLEIQIALDDSRRKLDALLQVTQAINNNAKRRDLYQLFEHLLATVAGVQSFALFNCETKWQFSLYKGLSESYIKQIEPSKHLFSYKQIQVIDKENDTILSAFDLVVPVLHKHKPLGFLLVVDENMEAGDNTCLQHIEFIQTLTNIVIVAIENKKLAKEQILLEGRRRELELAAEMQNLLFPEHLPVDAVMDIAAYYQPHDQVGGDYYDFIRINEELVGFCMADVSGKGIAAAILMSNFQANIRALLENSRSLTDLVIKLNKKVMNAAKGEKFITLFVALYNIHTRELQYINAGHSLPVLIDNEEAHLLKSGCIGLGIMDKIPRIAEGRVIINPNARIMCYTDGVVEQENEDKKAFGLDNLIRLLIENNELPSTKMNDILVKKLHEYREESHIGDDIALLNCKFY